MESCGHFANCKWSHVILRCIDQKLLSLMLFSPPKKNKPIPPQNLKVDSRGQFSTDRAEIFCWRLFMDLNKSKFKPLHFETKVYL